MTSGPYRRALLIAVAVLATACLARPVQAQVRSLYIARTPVPYYYGPGVPGMGFGGMGFGAPGLVGPGFAVPGFPAGFGPPPYFVAMPVPTFIALGPTTVWVPDGGTVLLGGFSSFYEARSEFGVPVLGKVPYLGRGFRNVGYGRSISSTTISVRARILMLEEEEARLFGRLR